MFNQESTEKLKKLLANYSLLRRHFFDDDGVRNRSFRQQALALIREGADVRVIPEYSDLGDVEQKDAHLLNVFFMDFFTVFHLLALGNHDGSYDEAMTELLAQYPDLLEMRSGQWGKTPLEMVLEYPLNKHAAMFLIRRGAEVNPKNGLSYTHINLLRYLIDVDLDENRQNNQPEINELISLRPELLDIVDSSGYTPLHAYLAHSKDVDMNLVKKLCTAHNINHRYKERKSLLDVACAKGNLELMRYFVDEKGLSLPNTSLILPAIQSKNAALVAWLIDRGQAIPEKSLLVAVKDSTPEIVALLIQKGADPEVRSSTGSRPLNYAIRLKNKKMAKILFDLKSELLNAIAAMENYGNQLENTKGNSLIQLAGQLREISAEYFNDPNEQTFQEFEKNFISLLHSKDNEMAEYRVNWNTIVANICIALTALGVLLIAIKLAYTKWTTGRALFFNQNPITTSEELRMDIEGCLGMNKTIDELPEEAPDPTFTTLEISTEELWASMKNFLN